MRTHTIDRLRPRGLLSLALAAAISLVLSGCVPGEGDPPAEGASETVPSCGVDVAADEPPERVFAAYQPAIEMAHALGISDRLVATAFVNNELLPEFAVAQEEQPFYEQVPSREAVLAHEPDFVLTSAAPLYTEENIGSRASLHELGIDTWLSGVACPDEEGERQAELRTMENVYADLRRLGEIFEVTERAEELITGFEKTIAEVDDVVGEVAERPTLALARPESDGFQISGGRDFSTEIFDMAGGENAFADLDVTGPHTVSTEALIQRDPDYILVEACCGPEMSAADAADDVETILSDPALANLTAVTEDQVLEFGFPDRWPGVRSASTVAEIAQLIHPELFG